MKNTTANRSERIITLPVSYADLHQDRSLNLRELRAQFALRGPSGKRISLVTLRRWADPKRGCQPCGKHGPIVILPTLKQFGALWSMPEWMDWFLQKCSEIKEHDRQKIEVSIVDVKAKKRAEKAIERLKEDGFAC